MGKIKSAREIAFERSQKIGATGEALEKWQEQQCRSLARGLVQRYLAGELDPEALARQVQESRELKPAALGRAVLAELASRIGLDSAARVVAAVRALDPTETTARWCDEVEKVAASYRQSLETLALQGEAQEQARRELARAGIRGTAIAGFNPRRSALQQVRRRQVEEQFAPVVAQFQAYLTRQ